MYIQSIYNTNIFILFLGETSHVTQCTIKYIFLLAYFNANMELKFPKKKKKKKMENRNHWSRLGKLRSILTLYRTSEKKLINIFQKNSKKINIFIFLIERRKLSKNHKIIRN